jgi:hypothetical protein
MRRSSSSKHLSKSDLRCTQALIQWVSVIPSVGVKRQEHGVDHSTPFSGNVTNVC